MLVIVQFVPYNSNSFNLVSSSGSTFHFAPSAAPTKVSAFLPRIVYFVFRISLAVKADYFPKQH